MNRSIPLLVAWAAACQTSSDLPWIYGLDEVVSSSERSLGRVPDDEQLCLEPDAYGRIELVTEVTADPGLERIAASYADGVVVRRRDGKLLASAPGSPCEGSRDAVAALAVARVDGVPTIIVAITAGGRTERATRVELLQPGSDRRLVRVFAGVVEQVRDDEVRLGTLVVLPGRLVHRAPDGESR